MNWLHPQCASLQTTGYAHWAVKSPRRMTWRLPFQEGEDGVPLRQPTPEQLAGGGAPSGPPQRPPCPAPAGPDMGQSITALTLSLHIGTPKISTFSGDVAPGKTEVSYEQWSHEVQCIKDHYPELVVRESIIRSLKGAAADMAHYMGPTAGVSKILEKLLVIFGMVASFDILMQNFYKITQGGSKKVPSFATRLEGTLNQIRIRCPRWIANHEVPWHLKEQLFHGVRKQVRDSIRYLYGNPQTTYSKLVVAAQRAESKTEETKVKARSAASMEVPTNSKELGDQIAKLMAALTRAEQDSHPASAPNSPRHWGGGRVWTNRNTPVHPSSHNGRTGLGQTTSTHSSSITNRGGAESPHKGNQHVQNGVQGGTQSNRGPNPLQYFRCQGWGHMPRECATLAAPLNQEGGTQGNVVKPPPTTNSKFWTFPLWPRTKTDPSQGSQ